MTVDEAKLRPFPLFLLHVGTQHGVDMPLVLAAFFLEIVEHVLVDPDRDGLLLRRCNQHGLRPVDVLELGPVRIVGDRRINLGVCQCIDALPIGLAFPTIIPRSFDDTLVFHLFLRDARR